MFKVTSFIKDRNKLKERENVCKNYDYCYVEMHKKEKENRSILKYNHG